MEYTKDIILSLQYADNKERTNLKNRKFIKGISNFYNKNKFIVYMLSLITILISIDLCMIHNFINLLTSL